MIELGTRLGPRARAALARCMEAAVEAGRANKGVKLGQHTEHAVGAIEIGMILDAAEAAAAALSADIRRDGG